MDKNTLENPLLAATSKLDEILQEKLELAFHKPTSKVCLHDIAKIACEHSAIDLAYAASRLPPYVCPVLYENLPNREAKINFIINTDSTTRTALFRNLNEHELKKLFNKMPTDEAVWVLEDMSDRRFSKVMDLIDVKKAKSIRELKQHRRNSAGRIMTNEFFAFLMDLTIGEASVFIRDNPRIDFTRGIFLLNESKELQGYIPARNMLINPSSTPLRQVMRPVLHKVTPDATREEVIDLVERYKISSLPVVDKDNFLVGVIAYEDVVEAMEDLADDTLARMSGTESHALSHEPLLRRFCARSPWLTFTLFAGLANVGLMSYFQKYEGGLLTFVLFFVPLINGMSGNIGLQCSTVLVRGMAIGSLGANRKEAIKKELLSGLFIGGVFGVICSVAIYFLDSAVKIGASPLSMAIIVGSGLIGGCFGGTLLGVFSPFLFSKMGVDPAISSGPIVTAFNDFLSMSIYFLIAWGLSNILI